MRNLTIPEQHQLRIARKTLQMNDIFVAIMGGMTKEEAQRIVDEYKEQRKNRSRRKEKGGK